MSHVVVVMLGSLPYRDLMDLEAGAATEADVPAFGRRVAAGATKLGLGVSAANADALRLYRSIGLEIDREWLLYRPAG